MNRRKHSVYIGSVMSAASGSHWGPHKKELLWQDGNRHASSSQDYWDTQQLNIIIPDYGAYRMHLLLFIKHQNTRVLHNKRLFSIPV